MGALSNRKFFTRKCIPKSADAFASLPPEVKTTSLAVAPMDVSDESVEEEASQRLRTNESEAQVACVVDV